MAWIEPEKNTLLKIENKSNFWKQKYNSPSWNNWAGYSFEAVCYKHIELIRRALDIPEGSRAGVWRASSKRTEGQPGA